MTAPGHQEIVEALRQQGAVGDIVRRRPGDWVVASLVGRMAIQPPRPEDDHIVVASALAHIVAGEHIVAHETAGFTRPATGPLVTK